MAEAYAFAVRVVDDGLQVLRGDDVLASVRWSDVRRIVAYKQDLFSTDEICLGLITDPDADTWFEIGETCGGFRGAVRATEERFPSISRSWFQEVMTPAFERKETVLWESRRKP